MLTCSIHLTDFSHQTDEYLMTRLQNLEIIKAHSSFDNKALLGSEALGTFDQSDAPRNHFKTQKRLSIQTLTRHDLRTIFRDVWVVWVAVTNWTGYKVLDQNVATSSSVSGFCMKPLCAVWAVPSIGQARLCHAHPPLSRVVMSNWCHETESSPTIWQL